jgi:hypothetical protein
LIPQQGKAAKIHAHEIAQRALAFGLEQAFLEKIDRTERQLHDVDKRAAGAAGAQRCCCISKRP